MILVKDISEFCIGYNLPSKSTLGRSNFSLRYSKLYSKQKVCSIVFFDKSINSECCYLIIPSNYVDMIHVVEVEL